MIGYLGWESNLPWPVPFKGQGCWTRTGPGLDLIVIIGGVRSNPDGVSEGECSGWMQEQPEGRWQQRVRVLKGDRIDGSSLHQLLETTVTWRATETVRRIIDTHFFLGLSLAEGEGRWGGSKEPR